MKSKNLISSLIILIGLNLTACIPLQLAIESIPTEENKQGQERSFERWDLKPGSVYDGDTLRVKNDEKELKIRFCGIDAPERDMPMGINARDHLRLLIEIGHGELLLVPIEKDRYGRTIAEVYVQDSNSTAMQFLKRPLNRNPNRNAVQPTYVRNRTRC